MKHQAKPFREQYGSYDAQRDIDLLRALYAQTGSHNCHRSQNLIGWVAVGMLIGCIAAAFILF